MQKLRWTERGWGRGFSCRLWDFQSGLGVGGDDREQMEAPGFPVVAVATLEIAGARPMVFVSR